MLKVAYTIGDPAGIGAEIFEAFKRSNINNPHFEMVLIDDLDYLKKIHQKISLGEASSLGGDYSFNILKQAHQAALMGDVDYLVTGPVAKESLWLAGHKYSGQTELLASFNDLSSQDIEMFFLLEELRVVLATRHIPLKNVAERMIKRLPTVLTNSKKALKNIWGIDNPKIAVAGLNPHAGENGILGTEEIEIMNPLLAEFKQANPFSVIDGPISADSLLARAAQNYLHGKEQEYDLMISAYHDQVLPMIKGIGGLRAINLTAGLPYLRVSVDHGTGFDIVAKGVASSESFSACTEFLLNLEAEKQFNTAKI